MMRILIAAFLLAGCSKGDDYVSAPLASCQRSYTGRVDTQYISTTLCYSYDKNGACAMSIPQTQIVEYREVRYVCDFKKFE